MKGYLKYYYGAIGLVLVLLIAWLIWYLRRFDFKTLSWGDIFQFGNTPFGQAGPAIEGKTLKVKAAHVVDYFANEDPTSPTLARPTNLSGDRFGLFGSNLVSDPGTLIGEITDIGPITLWGGKYARKLKVRLPNISDPGFKYPALYIISDDPYKMIV